MVNHQLDIVSGTAVWFLVGVICSTIILVIFFLYITKRVCFKECEGCDPLLRPEHQKLENSAMSNAYDDSDSASSLDSAEENTKVIRNSFRRSRNRNTISSSALSIENEYLNNGQHRRLGDLPQRSSGSSTNGHSHQLSTSGLSRDSIPETSPPEHADYSRRSPSPINADFYGENGSNQFIYDNGSNGSMASTTSWEKHGRGFARKTLRHKTPSPSMGSRQSLESVPENDKWDLEETESIYARRRDESSSQDSDDEANQRRGAKYEGSMTETTSDDDGEYHGGAVEPISACGTLDVAVQYSMSDKKLQITIIEAHDLPSKSRGGFSIVQVKAVLLPEKRKKYKTKVQHISSPRFAETFRLSRASPEDLKGLALRLRMYGIGKIKDSLIGEAIIRFDELNLIRDPQLTIQLQLEPRTDINRDESNTSLNQIGSRSSSMMSLSHGGSPPEILIGLSYSAPTGRLCVQVIKGSHFRNLAASRPPDTFVKLSLLNSACQEVSQSKTTIRRGQPNPVYKEHFYFQVALFQLSEVTLMVSVFNKRTIKKKEMIGWVSMGRNRSSDIDEQHWTEMKDGKGQEICRWHGLIDT